MLPSGLINSMPASRLVLKAKPFSCPLISSVAVLSIHCSDRCVATLCSPLQCTGKRAGGQSHALQLPSLSSITLFVLRYSELLMLCLALFAFFSVPASRLVLKAKPFSCPAARHHVMHSSLVLPCL
jgi:hypothetical protein